MHDRNILTKKEKKNLLEEFRTQDITGEYKMECYVLDEQKRWKHITRNDISESIIL